METNQQKELTPWYKKSWGILLIILSVITLTFAIPLFIIMWQSKKWPLWGKILVTVIVVGYFGSALLLRFTTDLNVVQNTEQKPTVTETQTEPKSNSIAKGYVDEKRVVAQNQIQFIGAVLNFGENASTFTCYAKASDANDVLMGTATVNVPQIKSGEYHSYTVDIETDRPASLVVYSRLTCE